MKRIFIFLAVLLSISALYSCHSKKALATSPTTSAVENQQIANDDDEIFQVTKPEPLDLIPVTPPNYPERYKKWGYANLKGEMIIPVSFADAYYFREGLAIVISPENRVGFIDKTGKYKIPAQYISATYFSGGLAFVVPEGGFPTCIDKEGNVKFSLKDVFSADQFFDGIALFSVVDKEKLKKDKYHNQEDNLKWGWINTSGEVIIPAQFEKANQFSEGLALVQKDGKWGYINKKGEMVIPPKFEDAGDFFSDRAFVQEEENGLYGYINRKGKYVIAPQFRKAKPFSNGLAIVEIDWQEPKCIDRTGKVMFDAISYDNDFISLDIENFSSNLASFRYYRDKIGYIDREGKVVIKPNFRRITPFYGDIAFASKEYLWGIINKKGQFIVPEKFYEVKTKITNTYSAGADYYDVSDFVDKFFSDFKSLANPNKVTYERQRITDVLSIQEVRARSKAIIYTINFGDTELHTGKSIINQIRERLEKEFKATVTEHKVSPNAQWHYEVYATNTLHFAFFDNVSRLDYLIEVWVAPTKNDLIKAINANKK